MRVWLSLVLVGLLSGLAALGGAGGQEPDLQAALDTALDDERRAIAFYEAVMEQHGRVRPFANIVEAERRHEAALLAQYQRLGLTAPGDRWADATFAVPETLAECADLSVVAEVRNGRIYEELLETIDDEAVRLVFVRLRDASLQRHLPAFERHGSGWAPVAPDQLTAVQQAQRDKALAAREAMFGALLGELTAAMSEGGPAEAIDVCAVRAPAIGAEVARTHGVRIGRTSWKLRNPENGPPVWAELLVDERPQTPRFMADRAGRLGALTPIRLAGACLQCHGAAEQLAPGVAGALERRYPDDEATGFGEGDLRGWFWIEAPAP
ncbi:MAG: DUF3365 domain-containing protein [Phycisphaerales bacterium JB039]